MKWFWLRAAMLGILIGPTPFPPDAAGAAGMPDSDRYALRRTGGQAFHGPGFYVWDEDAREAADWARALRQSVARAGDLADWRRVAASAVALPSVLTRQEEAELETWAQDASEADGLAPLGVLLCLLPSLDRTCLVSTWATSPDARTRRALARALAAPFEAIGVDAALEHLQADPDPRTRRLARSAAAARRASLG